MRTADVVVIGGGIQGLSNAYELCRRGLKVALVEQADFANGTTSRSDGDNFICDAAPGFTTGFASAAVKLMAEFVKELGYDVDWMEKGMVMLAETEEELSVAKQIYAEKIAAGVGVRLMDSKDVHEDEPNTAPDVAGALEFTAGGSLSPMLLAFGMAERIKAMGGELLRFTKVTGFGFDEKGAVNRVVTDRGDILTERVVLAAGIWSTGIAVLARLSIPVTTMKGDLLVVEPGQRITRRKTMEIGYALVRNENDTVERTVTPFMRQHGVGLLIEPTGSHNALVGFSKYPADSAVSSNLVTRAIAKRAIRFFPIMCGMNVIRCYAGLRPWTPDHEAIVSKTRIPGFYLCTGHCGNGITNGPLSAKCLAQLMFDEPADFDMAKLSVERFSTQK
ncbi:MAG: FAD-binding oxidoreductase [Clostridiales bacterium]|nr:FAD-binding oxidoreductase [Clostridiales bacterium]